jgi:hypothetical protein
MSFLEAIGALGARETTCLGSLVSVRAPSWLVHTPAVHTSQISNVAICQNVMTTAHFLLASIHVTSARGLKPVATVLRLVFINS